MSEQVCRRCSACSIDWPNYSTYARCPVCAMDTWSCSSGSPLTERQAIVIVRLAKFDAYYLQTRGVPADCGGDPDTDPNRAGIPPQPCSRQHEDGFICWYCDDIPRRPPDGTLWADSGALRLELG